MANKTQSDIELIVRYLINDTEITLVPGDIFTYVSSSIFTLSESNVNSIVGVWVNDVELGSGKYSFDAVDGRLTITDTLVVGDNIEVQYKCYANYSSSEIWNYIQAALVHLSVNNYATYSISETYVVPEPSDSDINLIALIAATIIKPGNISYALPDIRITVPDDVPTNEKIIKLICAAKQNGFGYFDIMPTVSELE